MIQILRRGQKRQGVEDWDWRRVPRVSLLPEERPSILTPLVLALLAVLIIEAAGDLYLYRDLSSQEDLVDAAQAVLDTEFGRVDAVEVTIADLEERLGLVDQQLSELAARRELVSQTASDLDSARLDWSSAMTALFGAAGTEIKLARVVTDLSGEMRVVRTMSGVDAVGKFHDHMSQVDQTLNLRNLQVEAGDKALVFNADIEIR